MELGGLWDAVRQIVVAFGLKVLGAFALWWAGRQLIAFALRVIRKGLLAREVDATLQTYLASILGVVLNIVLVIGILGFFGVETTSFAALMAAAGVAIGAAWSGLLSNFAAGAFLIVLRPFKVGDSIEVGSVGGTVTEVGLFATHLLGRDNVATMVGNAKILGGDLRNFSATGYRRFERTVVVPLGPSVPASIERLRAAIAEAPDVLADPPPQVALVDVAEGGVTVVARVCAEPQRYGAAVDAVNRVVCEQFGPGVASTPEPDAATGTPGH
jgi:small conductance mechanosensitive channel